MKALSLSQPWASVILTCGKRIENRVRRGPWRGGCSYRGPVLLHASAGLGTYAQIEERVDTMVKCGVPLRWLESQLRDVRTHASSKVGPMWKPREILPLGGVVGIAKIVDVVDPTRSNGLFGGGDELERVEREHGLKDQRRWWFGGFALVLTDVRVLPFRPVNGALGLFELPEDFARAK